MTTVKGRKEMWPIMHSLTTNRSVSTACIISDNGKNFLSQKQKEDGFIRLCRDGSYLKIEKHERGMKTLNSRLRSEVVDSEVCEGLATDEVKAVNYNNKAAGPDKIHPTFQHYLVPVSIFLLTSNFNKL